MTIRRFGIVILAIGFGLGIPFLIGTVTSLTVSANQVYGQITESDPNWVPRFQDSTGKPVQAGECGQATTVVGGYVSWHKIECPK